MLYNDEHLTIDSSSKSNEYGCKPDLRLSDLPSVVVSHQTTELDFVVEAEELDDVPERRCSTDWFE